VKDVIVSLRRDEQRMRVVISNREAISGGCCPSDAEAMAMLVNMLTKGEAALTDGGFLVSTRDDKVLARVVAQTKVNLGPAFRVVDALHDERVHETEPDPGKDAT
jgi:hypothetical protein